MTDTTTQSLSDEKKYFNVNVGILGHVDSGKTSLSKTLSTIASTAAFDKNPQSQQRGITLDLGFSCFYDPLLKNDYYTGGVQYTLVDCPGHATLIRTIIGGAQIIDIMILVIDVTKGIQTQTAECIIIGELLAREMIVVLNKTDMLPPSEKTEKLNKMKTLLVKNVFSKTKFKQPTIVPLSAASHEGIQDLIAELGKKVIVPSTAPIKTSDKLLFAVDHCFPIKGKGTVLTGTILRGNLEVNQTIEIPSLHEQRKVKSIQMFKKPVSIAFQGDRVGALVTQFDAEKFERGLVCDPGLVTLVHSIVCKVERISYFKRKIETKAKYHITVGHTTVMGNALFFSRAASASDIITLDNVRYMYEDELKEPSTTMDYFVRLDLESPIECYPGARFIASKLDTDVNENVCRLAFHGIMQPQQFKENTSDYLDKTLIVVKNKVKEAQIDKRTDDYSLLGKNIVQKKVTADYLQAYVGKKICLEKGDQSVEGTIDSTFGKTGGKFKVRFAQSIPSSLDGFILRLKYQINIFDKERKWMQ